MRQKNQLSWFLLGGFFFFFISNALFSAGWQQRVDYKMNINLDVNTHQFTGTQTLTYFNNSPDTLDKIFYHLYFNAFQPESMMDIRTRNIADPDKRILNRLPYLKPEEIGYHKVKALSQDEQPTKWEVSGTILEVQLAKPILPGAKTTLYMEFESQVPELIRRSGRNNKEGVNYSLGQWYPKVSEYDHEGWHADPYIFREFHGVWGDFDVKFTLDPTYTVGATGQLQNPTEVGHGYSKGDPKGKKPLTWHFVAKNVHDFFWCADPEYAHDIVQVPDGPELHFFYQTTLHDSLLGHWKELQPATVKAFQFMNQHFGKYPYPVFSVMQGGDGGMEYPMGTIITGKRPFKSLVGVTIHEMIHSWYQGVLASDEGKYPWMDEGFTTYLTSRVSEHVFNTSAPNPHARAYGKYFGCVAAEVEEPSTTQSDYFETNQAYYTTAYFKSAVMLHQLSYIIGQKAVDKALLRYHQEFKFTHPTPYDFKRLAEKTAGLELDWYFEQWIQSTRHIDYGIKELVPAKGKTYVTLERIGEMAMPIELVVTLKSGKEMMVYLPLRVMRGEKKAETDMSRTVGEDWPWTHPEYVVELPYLYEDIEKMEIDPSQRLADLNRSNNSYEAGIPSAGPR